MSRPPRLHPRGRGPRPPRARPAPRRHPAHPRRVRRRHAAQLPSHGGLPGYARWLAGMSDGVDIEVAIAWQAGPTSTPPLEHSWVNGLRADGRTRRRLLTTGIRERVADVVRRALAGEP